MKVNRNGRLETVEVTADSEGFCSQAGALLLGNLCDGLGLTEALGEALAPRRGGRRKHGTFSKSNCDNSYYQGRHPHDRLDALGGCPRSQSRSSR